MTVYEQIQHAINFIENNLTRKLTCGMAAREAHMSIRSFYNYFWALAGVTYKEYVVKRRMSKALSDLLKGENKIIDVAFDSGYQSHEAFSRAFKAEFGVSPIRFRHSRQKLKGLEKITIIKEMYMGVIVKELEDMEVACFDGFAPEPEHKAFEKMEAWKSGRKAVTGPYRIFGYNIDRKGELAHDPDNVGYRVMITVDPDRPRDQATQYRSIQAGKFVVTGIEGNIAADPSGKWITAGWQKLHTMIADKQYKVKCPARYFEEQLEPSRPGNLRLDLYLEIE
jgi:AraC-like DNA-binding protein